MSWFIAIGANRAGQGSIWLAHRCRRCAEYAHSAVVIRDHPDRDAMVAYTAGQSRGDRRNRW